MWSIGTTMLERLDVVNHVPRAGAGIIAGGRARMLPLESGSGGGTALYPASGRPFARLAVTRGVPARVAWQRSVISEREGCGQYQESGSHTLYIGGLR